MFQRSKVQQTTHHQHASKDLPKFSKYKKQKKKNLKTVNIDKSDKRNPLKTDEAFKKDSR